MTSQSTPRPRSPVAFYLVLLALAVPIWLLSPFAGVIGSMKIPVTDLALAFAPLTAGAILVLLGEGPRGLGEFLLRVFDF